MPISALNSETIKLITTTQVITSIWSVVKELIENSLDAGTENVEINLIDNGLSLIEIWDDGNGIAKEDAPFMALPSYTSKLTDMKDLESLTSYGFRGVALNSICAIADVTIRTKTKDNEATLYKLNYNGQIISAEPTHRPVGTTVQVRNLFKNLPVRKKIFSDAKKTKLEVANLELLIKSFAICKPGVRFKFTVNKSQIFTKEKAKNVREALLLIHGSKLILNLENIIHKIAKTNIHLMIPKKDIKNVTDISKYGHCYEFVNERPVKHKDLEKVINKRIVEFFSLKNQSIKKSLSYVSLTVDSSEIDVNVEPNKSRVFLQNEKEILEAVENILIEYYGLKKDDEIVIKEKISDDIEMTINDEKLNESDTDIKRPVFKKRKLTVDNVNEKCIVVETVEESDQKSDKRSVGDLLKNVKPLVLSESDSDVENESSKNRNSFNQMETILEKSKDLAEKSETKENSRIYNQNEEKYEESLSQLPIVDLGEDFDFNEMLKDASSTLDPSNNKESWIKIDNTFSTVTHENENLLNASKLLVIDLDTEMNNQSSSKSVENVENLTTSTTSYDNKINTEISKQQIPEIGSAAWSKGYVPGGGGVDVIIPNKIIAISDKEMHHKQYQQMTPAKSSFALFFRENMLQLSKESPELSKPEMAKLISDRWHKLSSEERGYYRDLWMDQKSKDEGMSQSQRTYKSKKQTENVDLEANKKHLLRFLENMKRENKQNAKAKNLVRKTIRHMDINLQDVTNCFRKRNKACKTDEKCIIIGPVKDKAIFIVKYDNSLWALNVLQFLKKFNISDVDVEKITADFMEPLLNQYVSEKTNVSLIMHRINDVLNKF